MSFKSSPAFTGFNLAENLFVSSSPYSLLMRAALSQMKLIPWFERGPTTESLCQVSKPLFAPMLCGAMWFPAWLPRAYFPPVPVEACVPRPTHQNPIFTFLYCRFQAPRMQTKEAASVCSLCAIRR